MKRETSVVEQQPGRLYLGYVAIDKKNNVARTGPLYTAGAKVYKSEAMARAAVGYSGRSVDEYHFLPCYVDLPEVK